MDGSLCCGRGTHAINQGVVDALLFAHFGMPALHAISLPVCQPCEKLVIPMSVPSNKSVFIALL